MTELKFSKRKQVTKNKKKPRRKIKPRKRLMNELDTLCREYIRKRDKMICQMSGEKLTGSNAHCSHVIPKSAGNRLRWNPLNLKLLSYHSHINVWHKSPVEAGKWFTDKFPERWDYLQKQKVKGIKKFSMADLEIIRNWYIRAIENLPESLPIPSVFDD